MRTPSKASAKKEPLREMIRFKARKLRGAHSTEPGNAEPLCEFTLCYGAALRTTIAVCLG